MGKLRKSERCPLHNSYWCPCRKRAASTLRRGPQPAVEIVEDPHHPDGQREICSPTELRRRKHILMARDPHCFYCGKLLDDYNDVELAHKNPKGLGGATHNDSMTNLAVSHRRCNFLNGSKWATPRKAS